MSWYLLLKLVHILCVIAMLAGMIGRGIVRLQLPHITSMPVLQEVMVLVGRFDEALVIRGSLATLVSGLLVGWVGGWSYFIAGRPTWIFASLVLFLSITPLVIFVFLPRGKAFGAVFQAAVAEQRITPALRVALTDPAVRAATIYESVMVAIVICLMVLKPF